MFKSFRKWLLLAAVLALVAAGCSSDDGDDTSTGDDTATTAAPADDAPDDSGDDTPDETTAPSDGGGDATDTLKIGVLLPLTGFVAGPGEDAQQGLELYFDKFGDGTTVEASGVNIEFVL